MNMRHRILQVAVVGCLSLSSFTLAAEELAVGIPSPAARAAVIPVSYAEFNARLDSIEKAVALQHDDLVRVPTQLDRAISSIKDLVSSWLNVRDERFQRIDAQFAQDAKLREQLSLANSTAIAAALQAAEKAVVTQNAERIAATAKSDAQFAEQLKQLQTLTTASIQALDSRLLDLKDRVTRAESTALAAHDTKTESRMDSGLLVSMGALAVAAVSVIFTLSHNRGNNNNNNKT